MSLSEPLILTLKLDRPAFEHLDRLRQQHFPPARNIVPAHITLFHALPGDEQPTIQQTLQDVCAATAVLPLGFPTLRFLGGGVAIEVECPALVQLRRHLATTWSTWLSAQDRQPYRPHLTIQNKVPSAQARQLYDQLSRSWTPLDAQGVGLLLWHYLGGPWELVETFAFAEQPA